MEKFKNNLINFINKATCSYTCIKEIKNVLDNNGYKELSEEEDWILEGNKFNIIRNDASIIAINILKEKTKTFSIVTTHSDTPSLILKPTGPYIKENYLKYNIKYQDSTAKNNVSGGSTLSTISLRHISVLSIDVGIPELAMH